MTNLFDLIDSFVDGPFFKIFPFTCIVFPVLSIMNHKPKKRPKTMSFEKKIGESFTWHDKTLKVVEQEGCEGCFFFDYYNCYEVIFATGPCCNRKDGKLVKFVELKKDKEK